MVCGLQLVRCALITGNTRGVQNKVLRKSFAIRERKNDQIPVTGTKKAFAPATKQSIQLSSITGSASK